MREANALKPSLTAEKLIPPPAGALAPPAAKVGEGK